MKQRTWPHSAFVVGNWTVLEEGTSGKIGTFAPFISRFNELQEANRSPKASVAYGVAKIMLDSVYGKLTQSVHDSTGKLWNPIYCRYDHLSDQGEACRTHTPQRSYSPLSGFGRNRVRHGFIRGHSRPSCTSTAEPGPVRCRTVMVNSWSICRVSYSVRTQTDQGEKTKTTFRGSRLPTF